MRPSLGPVLLAIALVLAVLATPLAAAAPPPTPLCTTCAGAVDGATGAGTVDVSLDADGDARWVERVPVNATAADRYADDPDRLEAAVDESFAAAYGRIADDATNVSTAVDDGSVVVTYDVRDVARPGVGDAWIVDYFYAGGTSTRYHVSADRMTLHPPDGTAVRTRPSGTTLENGSLTWHGDDPGPVTSDFSPKTLVTYGPGGVSTAVAAHASIATAVGPQVAHDAALGGLVPAVAVGGVALASARLDRLVVADVVRRRASRLGATLGIDDVGDATVALGLAGVAVALVGVALGTGPTVANAAALGVAAGCYAAVVAVVRRLETVGTRTLLGAAAVGALCCGAATWGLTRSPNAGVPAAFALATLSFLPLGHALERGTTGGIAASAALALAGPFLAVAILAPTYAFGLGPIVYGLLMLPTALLAAAAGYPLSVVGRRLAADR